MALSSSIGGCKTARPFNARSVAAAASVALLAVTIGLPFAFVPAVQPPHSGVSDGVNQSIQMLNSSSVDPLIDLGLPEAAISTEVTLEQFISRGAIAWGGYKFTYYSQQVLPGAGLNIPGRHVNAGGFVSDAAGYIVLAGAAPMGTVYDTPFGYQGKIYDRGTKGNHLDVYIR